MGLIDFGCDTSFLCFSFIPIGSIHYIILTFFAHKTIFKHFFWFVYDRLSARALIFNCMISSFRLDRYIDSRIFAYGCKYITQLLTSLVTCWFCWTKALFYFLVSNIYYVLLLLLTACQYSADTLAPKTYLYTRYIHNTDNLILVVSYLRVSNKRTCSVKAVAEKLDFTHSL